MATPAAVVPATKRTSGPLHAQGRGRETHTGGRWVSDRPVRLGHGDLRVGEDALRAPRRWRHTRLCVSVFSTRHSYRLVTTRRRRGVHRRSCSGALPLCTS